MNNISPSERRKKLKSQTGKLKETLAEMSFIEAEEALERSDRSSAISSIKEAIKNFPENPEYYLKLSELLEADSLTEAIATLNKALEHVPDNEEVTEKLEQLKKLTQLKQAKKIKPIGNIPITPTQDLSQQKRKKGVITIPPALYKTGQKKGEDDSSQSAISENTLDNSPIKETMPLESALKTSINNHNNKTQEIVSLPPTTNDSSSGKEKLLCPKCNLVNNLQNFKCERCGNALNSFNRIKYNTAEISIKDLNKEQPLEKSISPTNSNTGEIEILPADDAVLSKKKLRCPKCNLVNSIQNFKCERCGTTLNRFNKVRVQAQQKIGYFSNRLKTSSIIVLSIIGLVLLISLPLAYKDTVMVINPLNPNDQGVLLRENPQFQWEVSAENILFLLTIKENNGNKVIERLTDQYIYTLSYEEIEMLKTGEVYQWQVVPVSPKRVPVKYKSKTLSFIVSPKSSQ